MKSELTEIHDAHIGLTLVGVGPGAPSLLTLAAVEEIQSANVIAYPVSKHDAEGRASRIASPWIKDHQKRLPLFFPMIQEAELLQQAWRKASDQVANEVLKGQKVVFLCQGDVSLFATSSYLLIDLKKRNPACPVRLIPGITAFAAAAAVGRWPLALQQEQLLVLPTPDDQQLLETLFDEAANLQRTIILLKLGHRWSWVGPLLEKRNLLENALFAEMVGWPEENVVRAIDVPFGDRTYFTMLFVRQGWPDVMPELMLG